MLPKNKNIPLYISGAVLLLILGATFLAQGVLRYFQLIDDEFLLKPWFIVTLLSILFLVLSVIAVIFVRVFKPLWFKRRLNLLSFVLFMSGALLFVLSLLLLIFEAWF